MYVYTYMYIYIYIYTYTYNMYNMCRIDVCYMCVYVYMYTPRRGPRDRTGPGAASSRGGARR